jgi:Flp pilus assembly pilin Flp
MKEVSRNESGQAVVEYILAVLVAMAIVGAITGAFRKSVVKTWSFMTRQVAAACPGCPPPSSVKTAK